MGKKIEAKRQKTGKIRTKLLIYIMPVVICNNCHSGTADSNTVEAEYDEDGKERAGFIHCQSGR